MAETVIKIESNPYEECIRYYRLDDGWHEITLATNPGSALHSEKLVHGFFPFKAEEIVKDIIGEFGSGDKIKLVFEGSDDEWEELKAICDESDFASSLYAVRSERHLANARDVLPEIIEVFKEIKPLVDDSVSQRKVVAEKIDRFTDVSSDIIPLCVLGNYSAGKSTFINALVGVEILPNGDEPVTARVFQIKRSKDRDRAMIQFSFGDRRFLLRFDPTGLMENKDLAGEALYDLIAASAAKAETGMASQINAALKVLNSYRQGDGREQVSDLIKLEVPFSDADPWPHDREFVIFDTPGSNSASNEDHARVLREAMEGLSNGLPIFVAEYSSLDSTDNEKLYREIEQIPAIDDRFAMIVVNKADSADLPKGGFEDSDIAQIMHWSIPSNLYGQGIYFVSSILGLGSKNNGEFMSDNYAEKFEDQQRKYVDPTSRFYKTLYRYDILPGQISRRTNKESEACKDLLLANSGLFCIENEIRLFAERYSAYNKCTRSEALLQEIIGITKEEIDEAKAVVEEQKRKREEELDQEKSQLIERLENYGTLAQQDSEVAYGPELDSTVTVKEWKTSADALLARQNAITKEKREGLNYSDRAGEAASAFDSILPNLLDRVGSSAQNADSNDFMGRASKLADNVKNAAKGFVDDTTDAFKKQSDVKETEKKADKDAADQLFDEVVSNYNLAAAQMASTIDDRSRSYWIGRAEQCRDALYRIATADDNPLSDEKREEVGKIIIGFRALSLAEPRHDVFNKSDFNELRWGGTVVFRSDKLFLHKVEQRFNDEIDRSFAMTRGEIGREHICGFNTWLSDLITQIIANITDYNPVLHGHVEEIGKKTAEITSLEAKLGTLEDRKNYVSRVIDWKD